MDTEADTFDELAGSTKSLYPPPLRHGASNDDIVKAVNGLALESEGNRRAIQQIATRLEAHCKRIETALGLKPSSAWPPSQVESEEET